MKASIDYHLIECPSSDIDYLLIVSLLTSLVYFLFQQINNVLEAASGSGLEIGHLFLVGGFAESAIVQEAIRSEFGNRMKVIIPQVKGQESYVRLKTSYVHLTPRSLAGQI